jgi:glycosidase
MKNSFSFLLLIVIIAACSKKDTTAVAANQFPAANAGVDITITLPVNTAALDGTGSSDPDGTIVLYQWRYVSGPTGSSITNNAAAGTTVTGLTAGIYTFELKITDNRGAIGIDNIRVTVLSAPDADPPAFGTAYANIPATEDIVMYEINERAFSTSGNFQGIIDRLDSIKALGINVIWLMPINPVGIVRGLNSPYCVKNYKEVNAEFGTLDILRNLVTQAHQKNMAVIIDWVANHTAWDNPWVSANKAWYTQDAAGNIVIPAGTNWNDVADLNYTNNDMRLAMIKAMKYWVLAANVDGFRTDAADMVPADFWKQAIDTLHTIPGRNLILLAEGNRSDHFASGFQMNFGWDFYNSVKNVFGSNGAASTLFATNTSEYSGIPAGKKKLRFTTNHDESAWDATPMTLFNGRQGALAAEVITAYMGGVPLIYSSQEVGRTATVPFFSNSPIDWTQNYDMLAAYKNIFSFYNNSNALRKGTLQAFANNDIVCFIKTYNTEEVLVMVNTRNNAVNYALPAALTSTTWMNAFSNSPVNLAAAIPFTAYEYIVLKK